MALFKILRGSHENLPDKITDGYCYFTTDTGMFYIDTDTGRLVLNANDAQTLLGKTVITDVTKDSVDIPTSGAVWEAIKDLSAAINTALNTKMDKENPRGTGYFSLNRKVGSIIGEYSFAEGYNTKAKTIYSHTEGYDTSTQGEGRAAHAEGSGTTASGAKSHAEGTGSIASNENAHAEGNASIASGLDAHAEGCGTDATTAYTHAEGFETIASAQSAHSEGESTSASGKYAHSEGYSTAAAGQSTHAEGEGTKALGDYSHAEGYNTTAIGVKSHTEGASTLAVSKNTYNKSNDEIISTWNTYKFSLAKGDASHVEGKDNLALGTIAHAEGLETIANGNASHAEGTGTIADGNNMHVQGKYNETTKGYAHVVGWGASNNDRKDIHRLNTSGDAWYAGKLYSNDSVSAMATNITNGVDKDKNDVPGALRATNLPLSLSSVNLYNVEKQYVVNECCYIDTKDENGREGYSVYKCIKKIDAQGINLDNTEYWENLGEISSAEFLNKKIPAQGYSPKAEGIGSMAIGYNTKAFGEYSFASGNGSIVQGNAAHAEGYQTKAEGNVSHAEGTYTKAYGDNSHAEGTNSETHGADSHAEGTQTATMADSAHAEGKYTIAYSEASHAEGRGDVLFVKINENSHDSVYQIDKIVDNKYLNGNIVYLENGVRTFATIIEINSDIITLSKKINIEDFPLEAIIYTSGAFNNQAHSEGQNTIATGLNSHAEGQSTKSVGQATHAEGESTIAYGSASHAEGADTIASGNRSHAEGYKTKAESDNMHVQGKYNKTTSDMAHVVGWGSETELKDIHTLDTEGNAWFDGKVTIGNGNELLDHETTIRNLNIPKSAPRFVKRGDILYLFANSCFVTSNDNGATFGNYIELCENETVSSTDSTRVEVRTITPILLQDGTNRIAFFYSVVYRASNKAYAAIRLRFIDTDNKVSDYINVIENSNYVKYTDASEDNVDRGGYWEPFPIYINNTLYVYYCNSIYRTKHQQSVDYIIYNDSTTYPTTGKVAISAVNRAVNRRPGMPAVTKLNDKYYMVVECNDSTYIQADDYAKEQGLTVAIALFSSEDGKNWEFNKLLGTNHPMKKCGAPYIIALPDGKIAFCFQCKERDENAIEGTVGYSSNNPHDRRVYTYISKENTGEPKDRTYEPINIYNYAPNEAGYWPGLFELDGVLYTMFTHCLNNTYTAGSESYTTLGNVIIANKALLNEILYVHNGEGTYSTEENMFVQATGKYSHAEGVDSVAGGLCTHSEGYGTQATKDAAHAEGKFTIASGLESHAEGYGSVAGKTGNVTPSTNTTAKDGRFAHAEGHATKASGHAAHSEGLQTEAQGNYSHTEGKSTLAIGDASHSEGVFEGVSADKSYQHITLDNYGSRGNYSHTEGGSTGATGAYSHAEGQYSLAAKAQAHAEGFGTQAHGQGSHSEGVRTVAGVSGQNAAGQHAEGADTVAIGNRAHAEGNKTRAQGNHSHAEGNSSNKAPSNVDINTVISEFNKKPFSIAYGTASHVEGADNLAIGEKSHAEGYDNIAYNEAAHVEGRSNSAFGISSHAEGSTTIADGSSSHSEGSYTLAAGYTAHAEGYGDNAPISIKITTDDFNSYISSTPLSSSYINKILSYNNNFAKIINIDIESQKIFIDQPFDDYVENISATIYSSGAIGNYSHSEGFQNRAIGIGSHSEGYKTISFGDYSHTEGYNTQSIGNYSHAEGENNATGVYIEITQDELNEVPTITFDPGLELDTSYSKGTVAKYAYDAMLNDNLIYYIAINEPSYAWDIDDWEELKWDSGKLITAAKAAHVEGSYNNAGGLTSHAEGWSTQSLGNYSHSEGYDTEAKATASHAEGYSTTANGKYSHVEGEGSAADGYASHAEGNSWAQSDYSHAEGQGSVYDYSVTDSELLTLNLPQIYFNSEIDGDMQYGRNMIVIYNNQPYIATKELSFASNPNDWSLCLKDEDNKWIISDSRYSHAEGYRTSAKNLASHSEGLETKAWGSASHAEGNKTIAQGHDSHAEGLETIAYKTWSHSEGYKTSALGVASHVEGSRTIAAGRRSHAENSYTIAYGDNSHAEGYGGEQTQTILLSGNKNQLSYRISSDLTEEALINGIVVYNNMAAKIISYTDGEVVVDRTLSEYLNLENAKCKLYQFGSLGEYSHSEGYKTKSIGIASHSEGTETQAIGHASHSEGHSTIANETYSHAEGHKTQANGEASHAEGSNTVTSGRRAHSEGYATRAESDDMHVQGRYNKTTEGMAHVVGWGTASQPKDIHTLDTEGNAWFAGTITGTQVYGAVWNDYAEYRDQIETIEPGYCVVSADNGQVSKTTEKFQVCDGIVSDTFGFAIGETDNCKTPLAVAGRVLAYCEGDRLDYHAGDTVCAGPNGKVTKMTREEIREWPDRIVGTVSEIPLYETWGTGNVAVNGRIWIKIK